MGDLAGKTVLITGAAGDIGRACTSLFADQGARLALVDLAPPPDLPQADVAFWPADVTDRAALGAAVNAAVERFGRIDAAVLAAGVEGPVSPIEEIDEAELDRVLAVNVKGSLFALQACLPRMKAQGSGSVVALSSISGVVGAASLGAYAISKHAVLGLVRTAALETGRHGVRVNAVCPGPIQSAMMQRLDAALSARDPGRAQGQPDGARSIPLQRYVTVEEVARMAAFLCSDHASSCHGGAYMVDGGFTAR
ncbi:MAG: SDR family NAD(P)-dependent oxidoreductase [Pseudomonadota bacterium]|jgi:NAD(P)-dependent dehydrogenase (short-subunit alcohol dehydrogenase family)